MNAFKHFISCMLFLCVCFLNAQQDTVVQLTYEYLESNYYANRNKDASLAKAYAKSFLKKATVEGNNTKKAFSYLFLTDIENRVGDYNNAINYSDTGIAYAAKFKEETILLFAYKIRGNIYNNLGAYQNSIYYHLKVDSIAKKNNDILQQIRSNHNIAFIKEQMGNTEEATSIFLDNLKKIESLSSNRTKEIYTLTIMSLAAIYIKSDIEKATYYNNILKELIQNDTTYLVNYYMISGKIACQQQQYQTAKEAFSKADRLATDGSNYNNLILNYQFSGKCLCEEGKYKEAIQVLEKAKNLAQEKESQLLLQYDITSSLAKSYKETDNHMKALENYSKAASLQNRINTIKRKVSKKIEEQYDNVNYQQEIQKLKNATFKEQKNNTILKIVGGFLSLLLLIFISLFVYNKHTNKKRFTELLKHINTLETQKKLDSITEQKAVSVISNEKVDNLLKSLEKFEIKLEFLNPKTSLNFVAKKLNTNTNYLSKIINQHKGKSFINYITELRINYALQRIKNDKVFRSYSIKGIAEELGFKSEGSFSRAFKKYTGIYPSYFIKNITANS
ncbi:helix-turn-helix domain-containing protein [Kordia sp.]|uniref:helix-turn-helix domain-containing protein n=1 Tax=Kordia sp. TaxID=1965332 RepID=UPI003D29B54A